MTPSLSGNPISIWEPRWRDRTVLIADHRLQDHNQVTIEHKEFPHPYYLSGRVARRFPVEQMATKKGGFIDVRVIPITELQKEEV